MADINNLSNLISKFVNYQAMAQRNAANAANARFNAPPPVPAAPAQPAAPQISQPAMQYSAAQLGSMQSADQAVYVKEMMNLPKNMNELVYIIQQNISLAQFNQRFANSILAQRNALSQMQAQILAQLNGIPSTEIQTMMATGNNALINQLQATLKNLPISSNGLINLSNIASMIQANGKDAIAKLITTMANSAKLGISDLSTLKETAKLINASVAAASKNDGAQTMKLLMLLYLPWLPLQEGVGFDIDIEKGASGSESDSIITITITTINYGNVIATLILESSHSVHVNIECIDEFPKDELLMRIEGDEKHYSMDSVISFDTNKSIQKVENQEKPQAKINMSDTNEINPYLLLMAHTIIRHVIEIDKNTSLGV